MLIILYSSLFSYMFFFSICIAPSINTVLDRKNSSKLLRKIFPLNFKFGIVIAFLILLISVIIRNYISITFSFIILLLFFINLFYLVPKINNEADKVLPKKAFGKKFKILHFYSVILYLLQMLISLFAIFFFKANYDYVQLFQ